MLVKFGRRMRELREAAGLSQEALADLAHLHRTYIGSVERGERNVSLVNITRIAQALGVSSSALLAGVDDVESGG
ncbi:helix-turn-helix domain-containing protein [Streptomyces sp. NPDC055681]